MNKNTLKQPLASVSVLLAVIFSKHLMAAGNRLLTT